MMTDDSLYSRSSNEFVSDLEENFFVHVIIFLHRILCTINVHMFFYKAYENSLLWRYTSAPAGA